MENNLLIVFDNIFKQMNINLHCLHLRLIDGLIQARVRGAEINVGTVRNKKQETRNTMFCSKSPKDASYVVLLFI